MPYNKDYIKKVIDHIDTAVEKHSISNQQVASVLYYLFEAVIADVYLRKDKNDKTPFLLELLAGANFGNYSKNQSGANIDKDGAAELASLLLRGALTIGNYIEKKQGGKITEQGVADLMSVIFRDKIESSNFLPGALGNGLTIKLKEDGRSYIEVDELFVRIKALFTELEIKKLSYAGGNFIFSPAGIVLSNVEETETGYKCYFTNDDGTAATENLFRVDDLCLCQTFNIKSGVHQNVSNKRYWRACTEVGENYFVLSKTDCESNSDIPEARDSVVVLGNKTDAERQNAIIISVYGEGSPSITQHIGINTYSLVGTEKTRISPTQNIFTGEFHFSSGENVKDITTGLNQKVNDAVKTLTEQAEYITAIQDDLEAVKNQADGAIESWFYDPVPTLDNEPAVNWTDDATRKVHLGDLYYDGSGKSYRFQLVDGKYAWKVIEDSDIARALAAAKAAQDTADGKRRVFVTQPTSESVYDVGDLWVNATYSNTYSNDFLRCKTAKAKGTPFSIEHWEKASKYTDDTTANKAIADAANAQQAADNADKKAQEATNRLNNWAADGTISPTEKPALKDEIARIDSDKEQITAGYTKYGLGTPSAFTSAYSSYRAQLVTLTASSPESITIPSDFRTKQTAYYTQRSTALNAIAAAAKDYAQNLVDGLEIGGRNYFAFSKANKINFNSKIEFDKSINGAVITTGGGNVPTSGIMARIQNLGITTEGNYTFSCYIKASSDITVHIDICDEKIKINLLVTTEYQKIEGTTYVDDNYADPYYGFVDFERSNPPSGVTIYIKDIKLEQGTKATAWTPAPEDVQAGIDEARQKADAAKDLADSASQEATNASKAAAQANALLADIANDNKLTAQEKQQTQKEWDTIKSEKPKNDASADKFGVSKTAYGNAYSALNSYITPLLSNLTTTSDITGTEFRSKFKAYYDARTDLLNAISAKAKTLADVAQEAADNAQNSADAAIASAQNAQQAADEAKNRLNSWAADNVISPTEKQAIKDEIVRIDADKSEIVSGYNRYNAGTPTEYNTAYTAYKTVLTSLSAATPETITIPSDFATKQSAYYTQRTAALNVIAAKAKEQVNSVNNDLQSYKTTVESKFSATNDKITAAVTETKTYTDSKVSEVVKVVDSKLEIAKGEITAEVTSTVDNKINDIQIGGRNYALGTGNPVSFTPENRYNYIKRGLYVLKNALSEQTCYFSAKVKFEGCTFGNNHSVQFQGGESWNYAPAYTFINNNGTNKEYIVQWKGTLLKKTGNGRIDMRLDYVGGGTVTVSEFKAEIGNKPTDWTPAPEDTEESISDLSARITITEEGIKQTVTKTEFNQSKTEILNTAAQDALNKANTAKNEAISTASSDATNKANQAKNDAISTAATDAQAKADAAKNAAIADAAKKYATITTVTQMQTSIDSLGDQLTLKASKSELTTVKNELTGDINSLTQRVSQAEINLKPDNIWIGISSKVNSVVNNVQVGGRNFIKSSDFIVQATSNEFASTKTISLVDGLNLNDVFLRKNVIFSYFVHCPGERTNNPGQSSLGNRFGIHGLVQWKNKSTGATTIKYPFADCLDGSYVNQRVSMIYTFEPPSGYDSISLILFSFQSYARPSADNAEIWKIGQPKLEIGTKATDWTPAPEDYSTTEEIKTGITVSQNSINILGKSISLTGMVTFTSLASDAQGKINTAQSTANSANTAASNAQNTANSAKTTADSALSKANTAQSTAETARTEKIELARLGTTVIDGGHLKTSLIDADELFSQNITVSNNATITNLRAVNADVTGKLIANSGSQIGGMRVGSYSLTFEGVNKLARFGNEVLPPSSSMSGFIYLKDYSGDTYSKSTIYIDTTTDEEENMVDVRTLAKAIHIENGSFYIAPGNLVDTPGVLLAGRVNGDGSIVFQYGKKRYSPSSGKVFYVDTPASSGWIQYNVRHNIGHTNYSVNVTPISINTDWRKYHTHIIDIQPNSFLVVFIDSGTANSTKRSDFYFSVIGEND